MHALPLDGAGLDALVSRIGERRIVLLGEASHGTAEFYEWRTRITERLVRDKAFSFVAVEGDWPDCQRIDAFLKGAAPGERARDVLSATFHRWPSWMWANESVVDLIEMLHGYNEGARRDDRVGFHGFDVYSLWQSLDAVLRYAERQRPDLVPMAKAAFECLEPYGEDAQAYAQAHAWADESCEEEAVSLLQEALLAEPSLDARQNAHVISQAEAYYRAMVRGGPASWNLRDTHMMDTLDRLLNAYGPRSKAVVWAHNTHVGDARATDMEGQGMTNLGQLARDRHPHDVFIVGFGTHRGAVLAGQAWEAPVERMRAPPAPASTLEGRLHEAIGGDGLLLDLDARELRGRIGHRAIGVVYDPRRDWPGNYVPTDLARRYDAFVFIDETRALQPLKLAVVEEPEAPETFPWGY